MSRELPPQEFLPPHHRRGLFYSRAWIDIWQEVYGAKAGIILEPSLGVYRFKGSVKRMIPTRNVALVGSTSAAVRSIRAEYATFPDSQYDWLKEIFSLPWDIMTIPDVLAGSEDEQRLNAFADEHRLGIGKHSREFAYAIDLRRGTFQDYLQRLGPNTRLKLFNRRKRLARHGPITVRNLWPDTERFYDLINDFHHQRWNKLCYTGKRRDFIDALLTRLSQNGHTVNLSVLYVGEQPVSTILDIAVDGRCYNLQSGFDPQWQPAGLSLGTLHFGYRIESTFSAGYEFYDLMAGQGKRQNYKSAFADVCCPLLTVSLVRHPLLKLLYRFHRRGT